MAKAKKTVAPAKESAENEAGTRTKLYELQEGEKLGRVRDIVSVAQTILVPSPKGFRTALRIATEDKQEKLVLDGKDAGTVPMFYELKFDASCAHFFTIVSEDKRFYVTRDGKKIGKDFGEIYDFCQSADGAHTAWKSVEKKTHAAVHDGVATDYEGIHELALSPDGSKLAVVAVEGGTRNKHYKYAIEGGRSFVVVAGKQSERYDQVSGLQWASNDRLVYAATEKNTAFVVDGTQRGPSFDDVKHLSVLANGKTAHLAQVGKHTAFVLHDEVLQKGKFIERFALSRDRKRYQYVLDEKKLVLDEKSFPLDGKVLSCAFDERSEHHFCVTKTGKTAHILRDGERIETIADIDSFSVDCGNAGHYGYHLAKKDGLHTFIDGVDRKLIFTNVGKICFSNDGLHHAFHALIDGEQHWVIDGEVGPPGARQPYLAGSFSFSDDGKHFAYIAEKPTGTTRTLAIDHKATEYFDDILEFCWSPAASAFVALVRKKKEFFVLQMNP